MNKLFGDINLTWTKVIILAIIMGIYGAIAAMVPVLKDSSFSDLTVTFEVWILLGIFIIFNSKSAKDSALKCFVFFLISQPLIYLIQDVINHSNLFMTYYRYWFIWTVFCIIMGYVGYYIKKDKWWGLLILSPILFLLANEYSRYLSLTMFSFPRHMLTTIFCFITLIIYPVYLFKNSILKKVGLGISGLLIAVMTILCVLNPPIYHTQILANNEEHPFDNTYNVYLEDSNLGEVKISYIKDLEDYMVDANFKKAGNTILVLQSPDKKEEKFELIIKRNTYSVEKID